MDFYNLNDNFKVKIQIGTIQTVNTKTYTVDVILSSGHIANNIPWISPYSFLDGNGIYAMPQNGATVLVAEYLPGEYICLGFAPLRYTDTIDYTENRRRMLQGDLCFQVTNDCYMLLKRTAEFINIQASPATYIKFNSTDNTLQGRFQRALFEADGGIFRWESNPDTFDTTMSWIFRDKAAEDANIAQLTIGFHKTEDPEAQDAGIDKSIFSLIVKKINSGNNNNNTITEDVKFKFIIGVNGRVLCSAESLKEIYRDFIDRYTGTFMKDIAESFIKRISNEYITDKAATTHNTYAQIIHHNKGS